MTFFHKLAISLLLFFALSELTFAQQQQEQGVDKDKQKPIQPGDSEYKRRDRVRCSRQFRTYDGTCTNFSGKRKLWGSTRRPQFSYFEMRGTTVPTGQDLPSARAVSNMLFKSSRDIFDPRGLNEMATYFGQFIDHTIVATPSNKSESMPIPIPEDDVIFGNFSKGELPFFRSSRVRVKDRDMIERPQNTMTSLLDLDSVYGPSKERNNALRTGKDGLMKTSRGDYPPYNGVGKGEFNNAPAGKHPDKFYLAGDHRANEHPVLTSLHTLFLREHNDLARELKSIYSDGTDQFLFEMARKINIAQFQKIVFKDWYPAVAGHGLPPYQGFKANVDPGISNVFSSAAFRVGHTMVGNQLNRLGKRNKPMSPLPMKKMFFNRAKFMEKHDIDQFIRGSLRSRAQKVDLEVRDALRNFLFTKVRGEDGFDLVALNIQRGRDHALPSYNAIRARFGQRKLTSLGQITSNPNVRSKLLNVYGSMHRIEAWPGMLAEDLVPGSSLGPTMLEIWKREFTRLRDGDSFYYEEKKQFPQELRNKIERVRLLFTNDDTFKALLLRHTDISEAELPPRMFFWQ